MNKEKLEQKLNKEYKELGEIKIEEISQSTLKPKDVKYVKSIMENVKPLESDEPIVVGKHWDELKLIDGYHRLKNSIINGTDIKAIILEDYNLKRNDDTLLSFMKNIKGHKIYFYDNYTFKLDGKIYNIKPNEGCGGCSNGWSDLEVLPKFINKEIKINKVKSKDKDDEWNNDLYIDDKYDLYINDKLFAKVDTGWGNGYYGGDFEIVR